MEKFRSRLLLEGPLENGEDPDNLTKIFCRDFRASLLVALIKGTVDSLNAAGMPSRKLVSARTPTIPSPAVAPDSVYDTVPVSSDSDCDDGTAPCTPLSVPSSPSSISTQDATSFSLEQVPGDDNVTIFSNDTQSTTIFTLH